MYFNIICVKDWLRTGLQAGKQAGLQGGCLGFTVP